MRLPKLLTLGSAAAALIAAPLLADPPEVSLGADELLEPYYAKLAESVEMPLAPPNPELAADTVLTRIAFGSCNEQNNRQHMWDLIAARDPQAFLFIGDNIYGAPTWDGGADLGSLRAAYAKQSTHS